jgi:hypothetical protein
MQDIMAELQQVGATDPAAQEKVMEDLRNSDPAIWPLVMQQFRATQAYRHRAGTGDRSNLCEAPGGPSRQIEPLPFSCPQEPERLPPLDDAAVAALEPSREQPLTSEPAVENSVVQASYPAPETPLENDEPSMLVVRNLTFCTEVQGYGKVKRVEKDEFKPNQETLLYAEVNYFTSESTPRGYYTSLKSSYRIFDADGRRIDEHSYAPTEDYCQNRRHDFFIGYRVRLPQAMNPGKYHLVLTIEDQQSHKLGQAEIEFEIKKMNDDHEE